MGHPVWASCEGFQAVYVGNWKCEWARFYCKGILRLVGCLGFVAEGGDFNLRKVWRGNPGWDELLPALRNSGERRAAWSGERSAERRGRRRNSRRPGNSRAA